LTAPKRFRLTAPTALEHEEQAALFRWRACMARRDPRLELLFAIPNGTAASSPAEAVRAKQAGRRPGVPDMCLAFPNQDYHGLFIELKRKTGVPSDVSDEQRRWIQNLSEVGYKAAVAFGWAEAVAIIADYLVTPQDGSHAVLEASSGK
jgi:hypothetical protein